MGMALISRKKLVFTMVLYGALFSRTQTQNVCSCQTDFQPEHFEQLCDASIEFQPCGDCSEDVTQNILYYTCGRQNIQAFLQDHAICSSPPVSRLHTHHYRCDFREGMYTCIVPSVVREANPSIAFYSSLLLNYDPIFCRSDRTSTPLVQQNNTLEFGDCCARMSACISPPRVFQNVPNATTLTFEVTENGMVIESDVILTVYYISVCDNTRSDQFSYGRNFPMFPNYNGNVVQTRPNRKLINLLSTRRNISKRLLL